MQSSLPDAEFEILLVPFADQRLPNPQHIAFEVSPEFFSLVYEHALKISLDIRAEPSLKSTHRGTAKIEERGQCYERFYLLDPSGVNLEVMTRV